MRNRAAELGVSEEQADALIAALRRYHTEGEFLAAVRSGAIQQIAAGIPLLGPLLESILGIDDGAALGAETAEAEGLIRGNNDTTLQSLTEGLGAGTYHSQALLTLLLWNQGYGDQNWAPAAQQVWTSFFDAGVAAVTPQLSDRIVNNIGSLGDTLRTAIAYSALPVGEGERPFGDTGVWSLFDDAGDLGRVLAGDAAEFFDETVTFRSRGLLKDATRIDMKQYLSDVLVQYAGALALYDVEEADGGTIAVEGGRVDARAGVLSHETADSALAVDLSRQLWGDVLKSNGNSITKLSGDRLTPVDRDAFRKPYFAQAEDQGFWASFKRFFGFDSGTQFSDQDLQRIASQIWGTTDLDIFDRFHLAPTDNASTVTLDARSCLSNNWKTSFGIEDGDVAVSKAALVGADLWVEARMAQKLFMTERLAEALSKTKLKKVDFRLEQCRVVEA
ncbi:hypothetical protein [Sphingobium yanoikuyae]|uniref:hypothetical protein n=1 Tax=Sphingobium yanoikuyae TaxID=13690 RepID=UPI0022DD1705|nr:hypothetical protein [Sphingobium yanoikuyae]WBQ17642.1 hypothetical protein PAE53_05390 [Sphingobium yanoikuyae]